MKKYIIWDTKNNIQVGDNYKSKLKAWFWKRDYQNASGLVAGTNLEIKFSPADLIIKKVTEKE